MKTADEWASELVIADTDKPWRKIITPEQIYVIQHDAIHTLAHRVRGLASLSHFSLEDARRTLQLIYAEAGKVLE